MALSGSVQGKVTQNSNHYTYHFDWSATQDITSNTSKITVKHYWSRKTSYDFDTVGTRKYGITIDGKPFEGSKRMDYNPWPDDTTISTAEHTVTHNDDGTKKITISTYANGTASSSSGTWGPSSSTAESGNCTASAEITLDQIPRAALLTDATNFNASTGNPTIYYSNPAGTAADVQTAIYNSDGTKSYAGYRSVPATGSSYTFSLSNEERQKIINDVPNGTNSIYVRIYIKTYIGGTLVGELRYLTRIATVNRVATISSAPNFTDEDNPTVTYSNPNGSTVSDIQMGIFNPAGSVTYAAYRSISKTDGTYTFNLTDAERQALINAIPNGRNYADVSFYITTFIDGTRIHTQNVNRTLTITNAMPDLSYTIKDIGSASTALTNNSAAIIKGFNYVTVSMTPTLKKGATVNSQSISNGNQVISAASGNFNNIESDTFVFSLTDSFGQTITKTPTVNMIPYVKLTCNITTSNPTADGDMAFKISGNYFNDKFGDDGVSNTLTLKWRIKINNNNYSDWLDISPIITDNSYKFEAKLSDIKPQDMKLDYRYTYTLQAMAIDKISTGGVLSVEQRAKSTPVYNWGANNFDINVPLTVDNIVTNNIFRGQLELGSYDSKTGAKQESSLNYRTADLTEVESNTTYIIYIDDSTKKQVVLFYDESNTFISETRNVKDDGLFTTPGNAKFINFRCYQADMNENYSELKVRIVKASPIKTRTLNGVSILGSGNLEVGSPAVTLYDNSNGSNTNITLNASSADYERLEIHGFSICSGIIRYCHTEVCEPNGKMVTLENCFHNSTSSTSWVSAWLQISGSNITFHNNITRTSGGDSATNEMHITKVLGYAKTGITYINGDEVGY